MPELTKTRMNFRCRCHLARLTAGAALLVLAFSSSPSGAGECDGYIGGEAEAAAFWGAVSETGLRACVAAHGFDARDEEYGATSLHWAAEHGSPAVVRILADAGVELNVRSDSDATPLHWAAAWAKDPAVIAALLEAGADPMAQNAEGKTPIHFAAADNANPDVVVMLIEAGVDPNVQDGKGVTPLHYAAAHNVNPDVIVALLEAGADPNVRDDKEGATPLFFGLANIDNPAVIGTLVKAGADIETRSKSGGTPLHMAATKGLMVMVSALLDADADPMARDEALGATPLHFAAIEAADPATGSLLADLDTWGVVNLLVEAGADPDARDKENATPLHWAIWHDAGPTTVAALLDAGADPNVLSDRGATPLILAADSFGAAECGGFFGGGDNAAAFWKRSPGKG